MERQRRPRGVCVFRSKKRGPYVTLHATPPKMDSCLIVLWRYGAVILRHEGLMSETSRVHALTPEGLQLDASAQNLGLWDAANFETEVEDMVIYLQKVTGSRQTQMRKHKLLLWKEKKRMEEQGELTFTNIYRKVQSTQVTYTYRQHGPNMQASWTHVADGENVR